MTKDPPEGFAEVPVPEGSRGRNLTVVKPDGGEPAPRRFRVRFLSEFRKPELPKLVRDFIGHRYLVLVYGGWSAGKSFFVIDLVCCIAFGDLWRGRACDPGAVVYIAGEAPDSIQDRIRAWLLRRGKLTKGHGEPPIGVVGCAPDLLHGDGDLEELCQEIEECRRATGLPIRVIVIDTMHSCAPGSREDAADTGTVLSRAKLLMERFGCAVIVVHHSGKNAERGARGSSSAEAAADVIVEVTNPDDTIRTPIVRKMRDGELPDLPPFVIDKVTLAREEDDTPVRCGVHELTEPKVDSTDPRKAKAREMRDDGASFDAIAKTLGIAKSTASLWCK